MQISLTKPELQRFVEEQVRKGGYSSAAEVIEAGLERLMLDVAPDELDDETIASIQRAEAEFERGEDRPFADVAAELRKKYLGK
jgi:putative addiction module CopG family antidote